MPFTCWLTRQCEGPWWMRMRTMSTSPRQAARCSGKQPLLSATFVDASHWSSFRTTSLRETDTYTDQYINRSKDGGREKKLVVLPLVVFAFTMTNLVFPANRHFKFLPCRRRDSDSGSVIQHHICCSQNELEKTAQDLFLYHVLL